MQLLERMNEIWRNQQDEVKGQTDQMLQYLRQTSQMSLEKIDTKITGDTCKLMAENLLKQADREWGGFGKAPKFPGTMAITCLLEHHHYTGDKEALQHALHSLDCMINGGIYDQVGGGFARYSTDAQWLAPHFEKMLYDNALLVLALCDAYQLTRNERYREVVEETIAFAERELIDESGIYYSALDADSEGVEGKYYTWTWEEWKTAFGDEEDMVAAYYGVEERGNWEHTNILHVRREMKEVAEEYGLSEGEGWKKLAAAKQKIFAKREERIRPITDDKSLLSWNALMNLALTKSATVLDKPEYQGRAEAHMQLLLQHFKTGEGLKHVWKKGKARIGANLDDYAYLVLALLQLASAGGDVEWIKTAEALCEEVQGQFSHESGNFFYYTSDRQNDIPVRKVDLYDGATPSANAVMAHNLLLLGMSMERNDWLEQSEYMVRQMAETATRYTYSFAYWAMLVQRYGKEPKTIVCAGDEAESMAQALRSKYLPECYLVTSRKEISDIGILKEKNFLQESLIFVCTRQACLPPVRRVEESLQLLQPLR